MQSRSAKVLKPGQLTEKDMSVLREGAKTKDQRNAKGGVLRDYSMRHRVEMIWDLNEEADRDQMFRMTVDDYEVILDKEELMRYLRWV